MHRSSAWKGADDRPSPDLPDGPLAHGGADRLTTLDGWLYVCGQDWRADADEWGWESTGLDPVGFVDQAGLGLVDIDGFGPHDVYLVGGCGGLWHVGGQAMRQVGLPSRVRLHTVCCGGDGNVYVSGQGGVTFVGRGDTWCPVTVAPGTRAPVAPFRAMVWFEGQVWATNDDGLWTVTEGVVRLAEVPAPVLACSGDLSVGDGVLLLSGYGGAALQEDGQWRTTAFFDDMEAQIIRWCSP